MGRNPSLPFGVEPVAPEKILHPDADGWICAGPVTSCPPGAAVAVPLANFRVAIFHRPEGFYALKDACPHAEYPLSKGIVTDFAVTCASHGWRFTLSTGECTRGAPGTGVRTFPLELRDDRIWIKVR